MNTSIIGKFDAFMFFITSSLCMLLFLQKFFRLFCMFQVPLISCASTWRAGETKNGACLKLKHFKIENTHFGRTVLSVCGFNS
jgi:hypothetical protein